MMTSQDNDTKTTAPDFTDRAREIAAFALDRFRRRNSDHENQLAGSIAKLAQDAYALGQAAGAEAMRWQTIETAPKDGSNILFGGCASGGPSVDIGHWGCGPYDRSAKDYVRCWVTGPNSGDRKPTHWQPLPVTPNPEG